MKNILDVIKKANEIVIGQEHSVKKVALAIYKHKLLTNNLVYLDYPPKQNLLVIGETGTGKTYMTKVIAEQLDAHYIEIDCKTICQEGWKGQSFRDILMDKLKNRASCYADPFTVVVLDEFDKLCANQTSSAGEDVGVTLQQGLLKYLEGAELGNYNTTNYCFILVGSFQVLRDNQANKKANIGFEGTIEGQDSDITEQLLEYGVIPEIVGRIGDITSTDPLKSEHLFEIIMNEQGLYKKWQKLLAEYKIEFTMTYEEMDEAVQKALKNKTNARGLFSNIHDKLDIAILLNSDILSVDLPKYQPLSRGYDGDFNNGTNY
jgi:ATP-dependent Clp protease ATP-binding subunit ClpX